MVKYKEEETTQASLLPLDSPDDAGRLDPETAWLRVWLTQRKFTKQNKNDLPSADGPCDC
jgi:hypothetical protein